ncbi:V-type proton ATPase subunit S1 [Lucilia cuprina]|uniref:V-type proton ATPase subunit S1 n=1 Tax=Lucilia cuprina TaxID=7375 RepID=UPI001F055E34|nr:V-type proton ATPase subunit S1 [Lucilia cuprina]
MQAISSLILALCVIGLATAEQSPVFLWGASSVAKPSLVIVPGDEFAKLVTPLLADKALVVFMEKDLTNKDFLCTNAADGKSCYARLQGVSDKTFYAAVENPVEALRQLDGEAEYNSVDASGKFSTPLKTAAGKINFVTFEDDHTAVRGSNLKSHDSIIASVTSQLGDNVFFVYTSTPSTSVLKRQRRETAGSSDGYIFRDSSKLLLYFTSLSIIDDSNSATVLDINSMTVKADNATEMSVTLTPTTGSPLTFDVTLAGGYFFMKNVMYNNIKFLSSEVYAPTDFSYFCGNLTLNNIPTDKVPAYTLKWNSLQFQAPFGYTDNATFVFGDAWHCVGFFTGGILSGLLIVALLLTITFIGVCWMMDINTMDRFDDPKGKTITINASD